MPAPRGAGAKQEKEIMKTILSKVCLALCLCLPVGTAVVLVGCTGTRYERSTGEYIDDKALNSRVKTALAENPEYKFGDVNVTSFKGVVQLSGFVNTTDQKKMAGAIAEKVQGVKSVENNVTVKEKISSN
jgi:hyperosmotically inducible periplasmic protein